MVGEEQELQLLSPEIETAFQMLHFRTATVGVLKQIHFSSRVTDLNRNYQQAYLLDRNNKEVQGIKRWQREKHGKTIDLKIFDIFCKVKTLYQA